MSSFKIKLALFVIAILALSVIIFSSYKVLSESFSQPKNVLVSNVSDKKVSISWSSEKATQGIVLISDKNSFPLLPQLSSFVYKDDGEKHLKRIGRYTTHHVTIENLSPEKEYFYQIYQGIRIASKGKFKTAKTPSSLGLPDPVYGRILRADGKTPLVGAIIYLQVSNEGSHSAVLSTMTNLKGGWMIDLSSLKSGDLRFKFPVSNKSKEIIIIEAGNLGRLKAETNINKDQPWPDLLIKK